MKENMNRHLVESSSIHTRHGFLVSCHTDQKQVRFKINDDLSGAKRRVTAEGYHGLVASVAAPKRFNIKPF